MNKGSLRYTISVQLFETCPLDDNTHALTHARTYTHTHTHYLRLLHGVDEAQFRSESHPVGPTKAVLITSGRNSEFVLQARHNVS